MNIPHRRFLDVPPPSSTDTKLNQTDQGGGDAYASETNFDTNMVIIFAALLCALICALGLNSILRCAMRCSRRFVLETPEQAAARLATSGLKKQDLRRIPVVVYSSGTNSGLGMAATECPICLGEFLAGEKVRVLPDCNHAFHVRCIDTWLASHSSCPNCRHSLLQKGRTTGTAWVAGEGALAVDVVVS